MERHDRTEKAMLEEGGSATTEHPGDPGMEPYPSTSIPDEVDERTKEYDLDKVDFPSATGVC